MNERLRRALGYSLDGLRDACRNEASFRAELALGAVLIPVATIIPASLTQKALLIVTVLLVLLVELLNTGLEAAIDRTSLERDPLAKRAKDAGSAAVLMSLGICVVTWVLVLLDIHG